MSANLNEWLLLIGRWVHITVGITWIGTSIFFMWLDRTFEFNKDSKREGHLGDLWMVHGGGFYHVEKLQMGPTKVPDHLHWFKWESYWTWISGIYLLLMVFYTGHGTFLLDSSVSNITFNQAILLGVVTIIGSWIFYDSLWEHQITKSKPLIGHILTLLWFGWMSYILCRYLSGRAAYIHIGAMIGTWMTANVFMRIIPRQVKMVEAAKKGEPVNQDWAKNAKNRSTHNTYFTLPIIFIMLSNHFPSTYGHELNWVILLVISAAGACIREYFLSRLKNPKQSYVFGGIGVFLILGTAVFTGGGFGSSTPAHLGVANHNDTSSPTHNSGSMVKGIVYFEGEIPKHEKLALPPGCSDGGDVFLNDVTVTQGHLKDVLVRVVNGLEAKSFADVPTAPVILDQKNCLYEPRTIAARVGQKIEILNSDPVFHNVRSISKNNENFNDIMPNKNDRLIKVFNQPEIFLQTKCSVHPWMTANIAVMDHPYFAVTNANGEFSIQNLPDGDYTIEAWHEVFGNQTKEISVKNNEPVALDFTFKN